MLDRVFVFIAETKRAEKMALTSLVSSSHVQFVVPITSGLNSTMNVNPNRKVNKICLKLRFVALINGTSLLVLPNLTGRVVKNNRLI